MKHLLGYIECPAIEYISDLQEKMDAVAKDCKVYLDVFCCSPNFSPEDCARSIFRHFKVDKASWQVIDRR